MFFASVRESLKAANPDAKVTDLGRLAGVAWKELSEKERVEWVGKSTAAKAAFEAEHGPVERAPKAKAKAAKETKAAKGKGGKAAKAAKAAKADGPKRGISAYMAFATEMRPSIKAANPSASFGELGKLMGAAWAAMDAGAKKKYEDIAAKDKVRYESEKA